MFDQIAVHVNIYECEIRIKTDNLFDGCSQFRVRVHFALGEPSNSITVAKKQNLFRFCAINSFDKL